MFDTFSAYGAPSCKWDKKLGHNVLTASGFVTILTMASQMIPSMSASTLGILCSTWVFMSSSTTTRSALNPMGLVNGVAASQKVAEGNLMVSRTTLLLQYFVAQVILLLLEQPISSVCKLHDRLREFIAKLRLGTATTWMGCFGADSAKGTWLCSNSQCVLTYLTRTLVRSEHNFSKKQVTIPHYSGGVTGGPALKETQEYTEEFCVEVLEAVTRTSFETLVIDVPSPGVPQVTDLWEDANASDIAAFIKLPVDRLVV